MPKTNTNKYDVITCGSATVDTFAKTKADMIKINLADLKRELIVYPSGSKIIIKDLEFQTGGGGTNTAVAFSRLGLKTAYLGNIGDDENGKIVQRMLKSEKVEFIGTIGPEMTNYSIVLDSCEHDRTILAFKDASMNLKYSKIDKSKVNAKWIYFSSLLGNSYNTFLRLLKLAHKRKIKVAFNPSNYLASWGMKKLRPALQHVELLVFNKEEANALLGLKEGDMTVGGIIKKLHMTGHRLVIITDGSRGAYCSDGKEVYHAVPNKVKIVETTGAGDAFASTFVAGLVIYEGKKDVIERSLGLATVNAASVIASYGAKNILLSKKQAEKILAKRPVKIKKRRL